MKPIDFHTKPKGTRGACALCGCPFVRPGDHRLVDKGVWVKRQKSSQGWVYHTMTPKNRKGYHHRKPRVGGPTARSRQTIGDCVNLRTQGLTMDQISDKLGIPKHRLENLRTAHSYLWEALEDKAAADLVHLVRQAAGTEAVLRDVDGYLNVAGQALKWCERHGRELFPRNGKLTLTEFYESYYRPRCMVQPSQEYLYQFDVVLRRWYLLTGNPPLADIDNGLLTAFRDACAGAAGRDGLASPASVNRYLAYVQRLLDKAGPPTRGNRDGAGLLQTVPWVRRFKEPQGTVRVIPEDLINRVYLAAGTMNTPTIQGVHPGRWWQAAIVLLWNTGVRRRTMLELQWVDIDWEGHCLRLPPQRMKAAKGEVIHLTDTVIEHLRRIEGDRKLVLPWPHNLRYLGQRWHQVQHLAGIPLREHFSFKDVRKTLATRLCEVSASAAQLALTHSTFAVTKRHYVQSSGIVARALDQLPQPEAFTSAVPTPA